MQSVDCIRRRMRWATGYPDFEMHVRQRDDFAREQAYYPTDRNLEIAWARKSGLEFPGCSDGGQSGQGEAEDAADSASCDEPGISGPPSHNGDAPLE